jgi:hypothetical protein
MDFARYGGFISSALTTDDTIFFMSKITVAQTIETAIAAERAAERLFVGLQARFANHADVVDFWKLYASDEVRHAEWLEELRSRLTPDQLTGVVDVETVNLIEVVSKISVEELLAGIHNLDDAYQLVNEVENGETNALFQFLLNNFEPNGQMRDFLHAQLSKHVARISIELPESYNSAVARRAIRALEV